MEKSFDLGAVLRKHQNKHKSKPTQFESVAGGVQKRMEKSLKLRKSSRLTSYDCSRNLLQPSPEPVSNAKQKADSRRQQLLKWKEEKEKKKKEQAAKKVKPFVTGVPHNSLKYVPPPPARTMPSTAGCVTRSQARNQREVCKKVPQSFAPNNAGFRAPQIKTIAKVPKLEPIKNKKDATQFKFQPVVPTTSAVTSTRSRAYQKIAAESKQMKQKSQIVVPVLKPRLQSVAVQSSSSTETEPHMQTSTSSSDVDLTAVIVSSSEDSNIHSSTENDSLKSFHSISSCEFVPQKETIREQKALNTECILITPHKVTQESIQDESKLNTPRNPVPKSESSSEERLRSPKSPVDVPMTPEQIAEEFKKISPCVTLSRGKDNARKEMKKKMKEGLLDEDASDMDSVDHFQRQLASEIKRMSEICDVWEKINEQVSLSESVQGMVLGAVGQARLLMSQKMQQFAQLVQRCARPEPGATLVTPADLRGFWDMVFIQVENLDMRFKELEELKARNWVEIAAPAPAAARRPRAPRPAPAKPRAAPPSRLRDMIAAARKAKSQQAASQGPDPQAEEKTFEAGFFCVRSPARSPRTPATPRDTQNLLKAVLSSEAEKASASKKCASFAILRASVLGKSMECDGVAPLPQSPLPQINLHATPGRSILKQPQDNSKSTIKQIKVVLFKQSDNEKDNTSMEDINPAKEQVENNTEKINSDLPELVDANVDTALWPSDVDVKEPPPSETGKENSRRKSKLMRQDALTTDIAPVMTRRMRKYIDTLEAEQKTPQTEQKTPQTEKITPQTEKITPQTEMKTPQSEMKTLHSEKKTPKRSARKKAQAEEQRTQTPESEQKTPRSVKKTPRRSLRMKEPDEVEMQTPQTEKKTVRRSLRTKDLAKVEDIEIGTDQEIPQAEQKTPKRSTRKKVLTEIETNVLEENFTPITLKRSTRRN